MNTARHAIVSALETQITGITGLTITSWREFGTGVADMPIAVVRDTSEDIAERSAFSEDRRLTVEITVMTTGTTCAQTARNFAGDINKKIGSDESLGGKVYKIDYQGNTLELMHEEEIFAVMNMVFIISYRVKNYNEDISVNV